MRKILVSTILGVGIAGTANASIVSSGFLDEKLTEMTNATTLQLDNKANQSDLTELSNIVAKSGWNTENGSLEFSSFPFTNEFGFESTGSWVKATRGIVDMLGQYNANIMFPGLAGVTYKLLNGWTDAKGGTTYLGIKDLNTKIGPLPDDITVLHMLEGWTDSNGDPFPGLFPISLGEANVIDSYDGNGTARLLINGANATTIDGVDYTGPVYPLWKLSEGVDKIGTLPEGITVQGMYDGWTEYGNELPGLYAIASDIFKFKSTFSNVSIGTLLALGLEEYTNGNYTGPIYPLWKLSEGIDKIGSIATQIGTLPDGYDSVGAALTAIKGIAEDAKAAALAAIPDPKQEGSSGKFVLTVDIVGNNATYRWEPIDRGDTTSTTE